MNRNKYLSVAGVLGVLAVIGGMMPHAAMADKPTEVAIVSPLPLPVAGTVSAQQSGNWKVSLVPSSTAFTIPPQQASIALAGSASQAPDPSGTRYAITSVTLSNDTDATGELRLEAIAFNFATANCGFVANEAGRADGPVLTAPPHTTTHLTFAEPFVTAAATGGQVCLTAGGVGFLGMKWSAVGHKL